MLDINDYLQRFKRKTPKILFIWTVFITFVIVIFIIINSCVTIKNYYSTEGMISNRSLKLYISPNDLNKIIKLNELYIDDIGYNYKIIEISETLFVNGLYHKEIKLNVDIEDELLINNNVIDIQFIIDEMTIFEYIVNLVKGE